MSFTYDTLVSDIANALPVNATDANFLSILPQCIAYAENRMQRDLDFLSSFQTYTSSNLTAGDRSFNIPSQIEVLQEINVITPLGATTLNGTRNQVIPVSKQFLHATYVSAQNSGIPQYFAMTGDGTIILGPWPDAAYLVEAVGAIKFTPLSSSNQTNWLYTTMTDLYFALCMVFMSGYQKNFGQESDDPKMAQSWENQYQKLLASAMSTEDRAKFQASAWSSLSSSTTATPGR